ncbi:JmjC domain-containing protein 4 [Armadillidium nasatum]|uniref:Jumonji domain-containing protein 4 n=1 Tax=Armadillidium nasatum TaxID=96803 RepID=A0A5N5SPM4_9CRUS|nr:JmjC domain-containing protein 4 [Armadillidium nasatum]
MIEIDDHFSLLSDDQINLKSFDKYESEISYQFFFTNHLQTNKPCIFGSWLTEKWPVTNLWVDDSGTPNCSYLSDSFGDSLVPISNCDSKYFNSQVKETLSLREYTNYYCQKQKGLKEECLYLKDWHFVRDFPNYKAYTTPAYFASDWLNEFWALRGDQVDDYRFVYIGPKGSWTPFHADVFRSFSWSSNICGRKRWLFFPPSESDFLKDKYGEYVYDVNSQSLKDVSLYPNAHLSEGGIEIIQERGKPYLCLLTGFIKCGIWLSNKLLSLSIFTKRDQLIDEKVEDSIKEFSQTEGWVSQCQLILKSVAGMDAKELFKFLKVIAQRRINFMEGNTSESSFREWKMGRNHVIFDIRKLITCFDRYFREFSPEILEIVEKSDEENLYIIMEKLKSYV